MDKALRFMMWTVGIFLVLCGIGRLFLFETWTVPNDPYIAASVAPTLRAGDLLLVLTVGESAWGDLVRCPDPDTPESFVVGRVVGLPGDQVAMSGGDMRVNGKRYLATEACKESTFEVPHPDTGSQVEMACARIELGNNWHFYARSTKFRKDNDFDHTVGSEDVYLLSDNRDLHDDSRDYGTLKKRDCNQRVFFRLWSGEGWMDGENRLTFIR